MGGGPGGSLFDLKGLKTTSNNPPPPAGRLYAMQTGMKLDSKTPECRKFLVKLMDQLETVGPPPSSHYRSRANQLLPSQSCLRFSSVEKGPMEPLYCEMTSLSPEE